jgi:hypothetical protein
MVQFMRISWRKQHEGLNEDIQNLLSYIGELIDEEAGASQDDLHELYEWLEGIMVFHYDIFTVKE